MKIVVCSDLHADAGAQFGDADELWENTRFRDAARVFDRICQVDADILLVLGDVGEGPAPRPQTIATLRRSLERAKAKDIVLLMGNHDYLPTERTVLDAIAPASDRVHVVTRPQVVRVADGALSVGCLPWTPPSRLLGPGVDRQDANRAVRAGLLDIARGLSKDQEVSAGQPAILIAHWLLAGSDMMSGADVMEANEPIVPVDDLEASGPWRLVLAGHNHVSQKLGDHTYVVGPPVRSAWDEAKIEPAYLEIDSDSLNVEWVPSGDRQMVFFDYTSADVDEMLDGDYPEIKVDDGALVRFRLQATNEQLERLRSTTLLDEMRDEAVFAGALKVVGPEVVAVERDRVKRSGDVEVTVETDRREALRAWLAHRRVAERPAANAMEAAEEVWR